MRVFDPVAYINEPRWRHSSLGLERISLLLRKLGDPQRDFRVVHVAGTNGKGSTCAFLDAILRAAGLTVGLFTSPYIERFEERIRVNGADIAPDALLAATMLVRDAAAEVECATGEHPTEFELMFAVACVHFARAGCDIAVIEVGLGGRLDATNVVAPELAVITRIGLDHTDILGDTLASIAREKAGIIKEGVSVVTYPQEEDALQVIEERCACLGCPLAIADFAELTVGGIDAQTGMRRFSYRGHAFETRLLALYQPENAAVAIDAAQVLGMSPEVVRAGIASATWPGRFEVLGHRPLVIVDGSHNPQGAEALASSLQDLMEDTSVPKGAATHPSGERASEGALSAAEGVCLDGIVPQQPAQPGDGHVTLVMGVLADKDYPQMIASLLPLAKRFVVYAPDNPRALAADALAEEIVRQSPEMPVLLADSAAGAVGLALQNEGPEGVVAAFGTLYSIGEVKRAYGSYASGCGLSRP